MPVAEPRRLLNTLAREDNPDSTSMYGNNRLIHNGPPTSIETK